MEENWRTRCKNAWMYSQAGISTIPIAHVNRLHLKQVGSQRCKYDALKLKEITDTCMHAH
jgi:hypothetical protein